MAIAKRRSRFFYVLRRYRICIRRIDVRISSLKFMKRDLVQTYFLRCYSSFAPFYRTSSRLFYRRQRATHLASTRLRFAIVSFKIKGKKGRRLVSRFYRIHPTQ